MVALRPSKRLDHAPTPDSHILVLLKPEDLTATYLQTRSCCSTTGNGEIKHENSPFLESATSFQRRSSRRSTRVASNPLLHYYRPWPTRLQHPRLVLGVAGFFGCLFAHPPLPFLVVTGVSRHHMFRLLGSVARGGSVGIRNVPKPAGAPTTALFCICSLWSVGQTLSFATSRTTQTMSSAVDVSFCRGLELSSCSFYIALLCSGAVQSMALLVLEVWWNLYVHTTARSYSSCTIIPRFVASRLVVLLLLRQFL